ncbi:hypothetical protein AN218_18525 [Streptomyces nanshensis]|uniref:Uncharacterized protein n=1 Tax=Streptomyces nanshensis TaxID=518642 RepID=A0A1E7L200_9ACTN|nr:hypothetical protein AN218_18525 [Streptomyces nanshensis]
MLTLSRAVAGSVYLESVEGFRLTPQVVQHVARRIGHALVVFARDFNAPGVSVSASGDVDLLDGEDVEAVIVRDFGRLVGIPRRYDYM